jgi:RNA polymerase sigma-70 factor, ECF subfamily
MELFERFAAGELAAFETLFRQFERQVHAWLVAIVRDQAVAEDLTVETFWRAYRARACFDPNRAAGAAPSFGAWVRRIATNLALDHLRRRRAEVSLSGQEQFLRAAPSEPLFDRERREAIARAFETLPAILRVTATLALVEERPHVEIAEAQGISVAAVKHRVFRAVRLLRERLERLGVRP